MAQISQVFISDNNGAMGKELESLTQSVKRINENMGAKYKLYLDSEIKELMIKRFPPEVLSAYESLIPYAYKADLARYCILHEEGGWYFDIGMNSAVKQLQIPEKVSLIAFRENHRVHTSTNFACDNCVIYAKPRSRYLSKAIELVLENVKNKYYGQTSLCPTGPSVWGRAIALVGVDDTTIFGDSVELTPSHNKKNKAIVLPDGTILAFKKSTQPGNLAMMGANGTNNYIQLWQNRSIYKEQIHA